MSPNWSPNGSACFLSDKDGNVCTAAQSDENGFDDSTYILDQETRYDTKVDETVNIVRNVVESGDAKIVIFSQWERMTRLIAAELDKMGVGYASLNGSVPSEKRKNLIDDFCDNPDCRVFVSTDTGSTGLKLRRHRWSSIWICHGIPLFWNRGYAGSTV